MDNKTIALGVIFIILMLMSIPPSPPGAFKWQS